MKMFIEFTGFIRGTDQHLQSFCQRVDLFGGLHTGKLGFASWFIFQRLQIQREDLFFSAGRFCFFKEALSGFIA